MAISTEADTGSLGVGMAIITHRSRVGMPPAVLVAQEIRAVCSRIVALSWRAVDVAGDTRGVPTFDIVARGAGFDVSARQSRMPAAAAADADTNKIRPAMGKRYGGAKTGVLVFRMALVTKFLLVMARVTIRALAAKIDGMIKNKIKLMHSLLNQYFPARWLRPVFQQWPGQCPACKLHGWSRMAHLAKIILVAHRAIVRERAYLNLAFVFLEPIDLLV